MDFDEALIRVQGALITLKRNNGLQKDTNVNKGENDKHSSCYQALQKVISAYKHCDNALRRIHLYLLLNSDFNFNQEIMEEENFSHLVFTAPTLDKFLFVETILMLDFQKYVCEAIVFGHTTLSLEYLDIVMKTLQYNKSIQFITVVESIISAVHRKLVLLSFEKHHIDLNTDQAKRKFSYYFKELLNIFSPPHDDYKMGYVVKSLLSLLCSFLDQRRDSSVSTNEACSLYIMPLPYIKVDCDDAGFIDFSKSEDINILLSVFELNLNLVNLTTWMYWSECEWKSNKTADVTKTVQEVVGEQAYLCKQQLQHVCNDFPEAATLSSVLSNMAIKPFSEDDEIQNTQDLNEIASKVKEQNRTLQSKKKWLIAMLNHPGSLKESVCFECIEEFGTYLNTSEEILLFLERAAELINSDSPCQKSSISSPCKSTLEVNDGEDSHEDELRRFVLKIFSQASIENQGIMIGLFYEKFGLSNLFLTKDFDKMATEIFNKAVNTKEKKDEFILEFCALCLQSPQESVQRLLDLATACNSQISFVIEVFKTISSVCQLNLEKQNFIKKKCENEDFDGKISLLCDELNFLMKRKHWSEIEKCNFVQLVLHFHKSSILHQNSILYDCLYPCIKDSLENASWKNIDLCLETMIELISNSFVTMENNENPAVLLAVILQVLEKGRHDMREKFSVSAASTCELVISTLPLVLGKFFDLNLAQEKDIKWIKSRVLSASPFSQLNFIQLWSDTDEEGEICKNYSSLLMMLFFQTSKFDETKMMDLLKRQPTILRYYFFKVLPSCTTSEWINVVHSLKLIMQSNDDHQSLHLKLITVLSEVLLVMITVASKKIVSNNREALHCIELYFKNFARIIKEEFWPFQEHFNLEKSCSVFHAIVNLLESIPKEENVQETCSFLMINILSDIIVSVLHQKLNNPYSDPMVLQLTACVSLISDIETRKCLARMLMENIQKNNATV